MAGGLDLHRHVGEHELHALELGDRLAELLALPRVADGVVKRPLGDAERLRGDRDPGVVEGGDGGLEPGSLRADHAVGRDAGVLEDDGHDGDGAVGRGWSAARSLVRGSVRSSRQIGRAHV